MPDLDFPRQKSSEIITRKMEDGVLILDQSNEKIHQLNETAARVWQLCDGSHSVGDIVIQFSQEYELDTAAAERDIEQILSQLQSLQLIELLSP